MEQILIIFGFVFFAGALISGFITSVIYRGKLESLESSSASEISSLEEEILELKKIKDDRSQLHAEIYRLQKENISLLKKI